MWIPLDFRWFCMDFIWLIRWKTVLKRYRWKYIWLYIWIYIYTIYGLSIVTWRFGAPSQGPEARPGGTRGSRIAPHLAGRAIFINPASNFIYKYCIGVTMPGYRVFSDLVVSGSREEGEKLMYRDISDIVPQEYRRPPGAENWGVRGFVRISIKLSITVKRYNTLVRLKMWYLHSRKIKDRLRDLPHAVEWGGQPCTDSTQYRRDGLSTARPAYPVHAEKEVPKPPSTNDN